MAKTILPPEIERAFEVYNKRERIRLNKIACWFVFFAMPAGAFLDINIYPQCFSYFLKLRLLSALLALALFALFYTRWGGQSYRLLMLILPLIPQAVFSWMIYSTDGFVSPYYAGYNLVLLAMCIAFLWTYQETMIVSVVSIAFYLAACLFHGNISLLGIFSNNLYFLFSTALFATFASYFTNNIRVREFANRYELDQSQKQLEESNRKLIELDQMKSRFFANISHELRTPLTLLISPLQSLRRQKGHLLDEESRDTLGIMENNAMRLLKLINDLLDLAKLESGRMETHKEPLALESFVKGLAQSIQGTARDKRVALTAWVQPPLGVVMLDRGKMEKIILNLLFNALKFTPAGGKVELTLEREGARLLLKIKDTGMGISKENLPMIFDRFWQADSSAQRKYQGTGIGLALVKELTEAQGGKVTAESEIGVGTLMTVDLPYEEAKETPLPAELAKIPAGPDPEEEQEEWLTKLYRRAELFPTLNPLSETLRPDVFGKRGKKKILVADDEPDMLRFLKAQLSKQYEVLEAVNGNQAVEKGRQYLPDLILLDMMMPEKDGIEACRELKGQVSTQSIPVVLLTARADEETKYAALDAGANDFLTKPFSTSELHVRVKNLIESHQYQRDLALQKSALETSLEQLKETEGQLVQNEKMASLGRLSAGIIHEINNPLNYSLQALYLLKGKKDRLPEGDRAPYMETLADITEGLDRVQHIVSDLRTFTHPSHGGNGDWIEVAKAVSFALRFVSHEIKDGIKVEIDLPEGHQVLADQNKLVQVFVNLIQNSADALRQKEFQGEEPRLGITSRQEDGKVRIRVRDNGVGIAPEDLDKIYDPFFTTKDVGKGMGLGLSICFRILQEQGGSIRVESEKGKFTEFILEFSSKEAKGAAYVD